MADYSTDFSEYTTGNQPSDWTERWHTTVATAIVTADAGAEGGKVLRVDHSSNNRYAISWDDVGDVTDVEILAKVRFSESGIGISRMFVRGSGTTGETGYFVDIHSSDETVDLSYYNNASSGVLATIRKCLIPFFDEWFLVRLRAEGISLKAKIWEYGIPEPADWMIEETNALLSTGWVGFGSYSGNYNDCDWFGVATGGDSVTNPFEPDDTVEYNSTDFSEYTTGVQPSDWAERWHTTVAEAEVQEGGLFEKYLRVDHSSNDRYLLSWDDLDGSSDIEIAAIVRWAESGIGVSRIYARCNGPVNESGYFIDVYSNSDEIQLTYYNNGGSGLIGSPVSKSISEDVWYGIRFRLEGIRLKVKMWKFSEGEPESWDIEETDTYAGIGWCGFGSYSGSYNDCCWFSIATMGGTAELPEVTSGLQGSFFLVMCKSLNF